MGIINTTLLKDDRLEIGDRAQTHSAQYRRALGLESSERLTRWMQHVRITAPESDSLVLRVPLSDATCVDLVNVCLLWRLPDAHGPWRYMELNLILPRTSTLPERLRKDGHKFEGGFGFVASNDAHAEILTAINKMEAETSGSESC